MSGSLLARTRVVLHHPFFPENMGATARAMRNCGLVDLRVIGGVATTDHPGAAKLAVASTHILDNATTYPQDAWDAAMDGVGLVLGTTSHPFPHMRVMTPREAAAMAAARHDGIALVLGNEKNGLAIGELRRCDGVIRIPSPVPDASLNLAQAAMVLCYEWLLADQGAGPPDPRVGWRTLADTAALDALLGDMDDLLTTTGFYKPHNAAQRGAVLRRIAARLALDPEEASVLRGLVSKLGPRLAAAAEPAEPAD